MTAGLKAGYLSDTWPLMLGALVPAGLFSFVEPGWLNLFEAPVTVMFVHRWLPFVGLVLFPLFWRSVRRHCGYTPKTTQLLWWLVVLIFMQIGIGITVVLFHVAIPLALLHQAVAMILVVIIVSLLHHSLTAAN